MARHCNPCILIFDVVSATRIDDLEDGGSGHSKECVDDECALCALRDCPFRDPRHYGRDGCPACVRATCMHVHQTNE
jgi:hypothetical protein